MCTHFILCLLYTAYNFVLTFFAFYWLLILLYFNFCYISFLLLYLVQPLAYFVQFSFQLSVYIFMIYLVRAEIKIIIIIIEVRKRGQHLPSPLRQHHWVTILSVNSGYTDLEKLIFFCSNLRCIWSVKIHKWIKCWEGFICVTFARWHH